MLSLPPSIRTLWKAALFVGPLTVLLSACGGGPTDDYGALRELAADHLEGVQVKVSYRYVSNFGLKPDGSLTIYRMAENYRQDWSQTGGGFESTSIVIIIGDEEAIGCTAAPGQANCLEETLDNARSQLALLTPIDEVPQAIADGIEGAIVTTLPDRTLADVEARCFLLETPGRLGDGAEGKEEIEICFSLDGLLLSMERLVIPNDPSVPRGELSLEVTEVAEVTAADFGPPYPLQ